MWTPFEQAFKKLVHDSDKNYNTDVPINYSYCCFLDALSELSDDDENLEEIDEGDGGGSLHHLHMLIFSVALSSLLTYYSVCSLK